ncbi:MAG: DUF1275 domain-containing protein [Cryobacterium sp.]|nr:DUF1275 domain-containing protein [Oligoflexia bacterium]
MFEHRFDRNAGPRVIFHWYILSFTGGCINAGGFLATGRFVSHVTGFATLFGTTAVQVDFGHALGILSVPLFFLTGAFVAGMLIERPIYRGKRPRFDWVMGMSALSLLAAAFGGEFESFGNFGESVRLRPAYILLALLCFACGLQNGAISSSSGKTVRTTHLTGMTTDLGLGIAKLMTISRTDEGFLPELRANRLRGGSIAVFIVGSAAGAWLFKTVEYRGFFVPALLSAYAALLGAKAKTNFQASA